MIKQTPGSGAPEASGSLDLDTKARERLWRPRSNFEEIAERANGRVGRGQGGRESTRSRRDAALKGLFKELHTTRGCAQSLWRRAMRSRIGSSVHSSIADAPYLLIGAALCTSPPTGRYLAKHAETSHFSTISEEVEWLWYIVPAVRLQASIHLP